MFRMKTFFILVIVILVTVSIGGLSAAQTDEYPRYAFGTVVHVQNDKVTIDGSHQEDSDPTFTDAELERREATYVVTAATELKHLPNGLADLQAGDFVDLEFKMQGDQRVAVYFSRSDPLEEE